MGTHLQSALFQGKRPLTFLDPTGGSRVGGAVDVVRPSAKLTFTSKTNDDMPPYEATLKIATQDNTNNSATSGTITIELQS